jgi:hypothetical protein
MKIVRSDRGFFFLMHPTYLPPHDEGRLASESSAIGDYDDSMDNPGSSFLWIGDDHHLNREEVKEFIQHLRQWLKTGRLD